MSYCITCWGHFGEIKPQESLYKHTSKVLDKKPIQYHHFRILEKHHPHPLSFENFRLYPNVWLVYKVLNAPPPLRDYILFILFERVYSIRLYRTLCCTVFGSSASSVKANTSWYTWPDDIKSFSSVQWKAKWKSLQKVTQLCNHWLCILLVLPCLVLTYSRCWHSVCVCDMYCCVTLYYESCFVALFCHCVDVSIVTCLGTAADIEL